MSSQLGDTGIYALLLPWLYWYCDERLGRLFLILLLIGTIIGNLGKNLFALPRPPSHLLIAKKKLHGTSRKSLKSKYSSLVLWTYYLLLLLLLLLSLSLSLLWYWDFGLPSTHSLNAISLSTFVNVWLWQNLDIIKIPTTYIILMNVIFTWIALSTCVSRTFDFLILSTTNFLLFYRN
jgi:hypothetical protein